MEDPVEKQVAFALDRAGITYERNKEVEPGRYSVDFYLPEHRIFIEVCQFHTPRKIGQMARLPHAILIQGTGAADAFTKMINCRGR